MAVCGLTATSSDVYVRKLLGVLRAFALALLRGPFALIGNRRPKGWFKFEQKGNGLKNLETLEVLPSSRAPSASLASGSCSP